MNYNKEMTLEMIEKYSHALKKKECWKNSMLVFVASNKFKYYVEGFATFRGIPIEHAWLETHEEEIVDVTWPLDESKITSTYFAAVKYSAKEVKKIWNRTLPVGRNKEGYREALEKAMKHGNA